MFNILAAAHRQGYRITSLHMGNGWIGPYNPAYVQLRYAPFLVWDASRISIFEEGFPGEFAAFSAEHFALHNGLAQDPFGEVASPIITVFFRFMKPHEPCPTRQRNWYPTPLGQIPPLHHLSGSIPPFCVAHAKGITVCIVRDVVGRAEKTGGHVESYRGLLGVIRGGTKNHLRDERWSRKRYAPSWKKKQPDLSLQN